MLQKLTSRYFNRYKFYATGNGIKNMYGLEKKTHGFMFDIELACKTATQIGYKFKPNINDPVVNLTKSITNANEGHTDGFLYISKQNEKDDVAIVYPIGLVPTHYMLYVRDIMEYNEYDTYISTISTIFPMLKQNINEQVLINPFDFNEPYLILPVNWTNTNNDDDIKKMITMNDYLLTVSNENFVGTDTLLNKIEDIWNSTDKEILKDILTNFIKEYTKSYPFMVNDDQWNSYDGMDSQFVYNKAAQFMHFSKYFHSLMGGVEPVFANEGGLRSNIYCPGLDFIFDEQIREIHKKHLSYPNDHSIRGRRKIYNKYHLPYWKLIYLRQMIENFGIETKYVSSQ